MNTVMQIAFGFCAAAVFMGAIQLILPSGNIRKSITYVLGLVLIIVLVVPIYSITGIEIDFDNISNQTSVNTNALEMTDAACEYLCKSALDSAQIKYKKITVFSDKLDDGSISISRITVISNEEPAKIADALREIASQDILEIQNEY